MCMSVSHSSSHVGDNVCVASCCDVSLYADVQQMYNCIGADASFDSLIIYIYIYIHNTHTYDAYMHAYAARECKFIILTTAHK